VEPLVREAPEDEHVGDARVLVHQALRLAIGAQRGVDLLDEREPLEARELLEEPLLERAREPPVVSRAL
jgi:hypothetical protein